jgi:hypothetical protein
VTAIDTRLPGIRHAPDLESDISGDGRPADGMRDIMREQLASLVELSGRILIQVVPGNIGANAGVGGPIGLAATDDAPELLVSTALVEDQLTNNPVIVRKASATLTVSGATHSPCRSPGHGSRRR